jgi:hypothetical protein
MAHTHLCWETLAPQGWLGPHLLPWLPCYILPASSNSANVSVLFIYIHNPGTLRSQSLLHFLYLASQSLTCLLFDNVLYHMVGETGDHKNLPTSLLQNSLPSSLLYWIRGLYIFTQWIIWDVSASNTVIIFVGYKLCNYHQEHSFTFVSLVMSIKLNILLQQSLHSKCKKASFYPTLE